MTSGHLDDVVLLQHMWDVESILNNLLLPNIESDASFSGVMLKTLLNRCWFEDIFLQNLDIQFLLDLLQLLLQVQLDFCACIYISQLQARVEKVGDLSVQLSWIWEKLNISLQMLLKTGICNSVVHSAHAFLNRVEIEFRLILNELFNDQVNTRILQPLDDLGKLAVVSFDINKILKYFNFSITQRIILKTIDNLPWEQLAEVFTH